MMINHPLAPADNPYVPTDYERQDRDRTDRLNALAHANQLHHARIHAGLDTSDEAVLATAEAYRVFLAGEAVTP